MVTIDPLGYIKGGNCDEEHRLRAGRIRGAWNIWRHMMRYGYVKTAKSGRYKIVKPFEKDWRWIAKRFSGDAGGEIGALRFKHDLLSLIGRRWFSKDDLGKWIDCSCAASSDQSWGGSLETMRFVLLPFQPPHHDDIYQARRKRGDFGDVPAYQGEIKQVKQQET